MDSPDELVERFATGRLDDDSTDLLALLTAAEDCMTAGALADKCDRDRRTVYRRLDDLQAIGFITEEEDQSGGRTTRAGRKAAAAYRRAADRIGHDTLAYLAGSSNRRDLLAAVDDGPAYKADLAARAALPSRKTIQRVCREFETREWIRRLDDGRLVTTDRGTAVLDEHEQVRIAVGQAIEKSPCLRQLEDWADPPLYLLEHTALVQETCDDPHALLQAVIDAAELQENNLRRLRSVVPLFDPVSYDLFREHIDLKTTYEIVFDQTAYHQLTRPENIQYLTATLLTPTVSVRVYPEPLRTGLGIYNESVVLGGSTDHQQNAGVVSDEPAVYEWAMETFETMWTRSEPPATRLERWLESIVPATSD